MAEYLAAFGSTHAALSFEAAFGEQGSLVPVPPKVRAGCGMGLRFFVDEDAEARQRVETLSSELGVEQQIACSESREASIACWALPDFPGVNWLRTPRCRT